MAWTAGLVVVACLAGWSAVSANAVLSPAPALDAALAHAEDESAPAAARGRHVRASPADRWLRLLSDYVRKAASSSDADADAEDWFPRPVPIDLPVGRGAGGRPVSLPVLILPVPVPMPAADHQTQTQCDTSRSQSQSSQDDSQASLEGHRGAGEDSGPRPFRPPQQAPPQPRRPVPAPDSAQARQPLYYQYGEEPTVPHLDYVVSSQQLVELFQAQVAPDPELPPAVISDYRGEDAGEPAEGVVLPLTAHYRGARRVRGAGGAGRLVRMRRYQVPTGASSPPPAPPPYAALHAPRAGAPAPPRYERSLMLRGEVTVPRAGYSEPYTVWWDAGTGAARVDLHAGATSTYRTLMPDGRVRSLEMRVDRSGESEVRRCATAPPRPPTAEDRALPALPDLQAFAFTGYVESEFGRVERWAHTVSGGAGELGAARGEALAFRHELLLARHPDNTTTTPLKYSVEVDSSVLGANCDGYVHRYTELRDQQHEPGLFVLDIVESCEEVVQTTARDRVEPLREFTMSHRDPRYDTMYNQFKAAHRRRYADDTEEAVRKNLMVQHSRFVSSGNRQGATFNMEVNHLGDRLDAELGVLRGVREEPEALPSEPFPHSRAQLQASAGRLPRNFDWRQRGAVTHVRNQGSCSSCWAFAVTGAVEGALFVRTRALVPLSEQCLVDCAQPYGGHGCGGTWPSAAYAYIQQRGLPALSDYTPYQEKVLTCVDKSVSPVTHISSHVNVTRNNVEALKVAIRRHAPTVVIIDATPKSFIFYKKGVVNDQRCAKNKAEHAVLAVGWGVRNGGGEGEEHILVKNSWSAAWGDAGYVRLHARSNTCGVLSRPSYPRLERQDVDRLPPAPETTAL